MRRREPPQRYLPEDEVLFPRSPWAEVVEQLVRANGCNIPVVEPFGQIDVRVIFVGCPEVNVANAFTDTAGHGCCL